MSIGAARDSERSSNASALSSPQQEDPQLRPPVGNFAYSVYLGPSSHFPVFEELALLEDLSAKLTRLAKVTEDKKQEWLNAKDEEQAFRQKSK